MDNIGRQSKFKTLMLGSSFCDYSDTYILVKETLAVPNTETAAAPSNKNENAVFKSRAPFADCISEINNEEAGHAKYIGAVMPMYNLKDYSDNYSKTAERLWQ